MSKKIKQKKGFTIIEVVLVLAIAGLIFLMVFVVVPQAMAGQRDGERRQAMSRVQSALVQYQTNNKTKRNNLPKEGTWEAGKNDGTTGSIVYGSENCRKNSACSFVLNYMNIAGSGTTTVDKDNTFIDPDGVPYNVIITKNWAEANAIDYAKIGAGESELTETSTTGEYTITGTDPFKQHIIYIVPGGKCSGENVVKSEIRHFAVLYRLEGSGTYCGDSD